MEGIILYNNKIENVILVELVNKII